MVSRGGLGDLQALNGGVLSELVQGIRLGSWDPRKFHYAVIGVHLESAIGVSILVSTDFAIARPIDGTQAVDRHSALAFIVPKGLDATLCY